MRLSTRIKLALNAGLQFTNLRIETLTAAKLEDARIAGLARRGYFTRPAFPVPAAVKTFDAEPMRQACEIYSAQITALMGGAAKPGLYDPNNPFFRSPDAEILYAMIRLREPRQIVEVGSGHSTRIVKQALADGDLATVHAAIDPAPRSDIAAIVDLFFNANLEEAAAAEVFESLAAGDLLFIDSSHQLRTGNDVVRLFCNIIPALPSGVIVHAHDVFLPYDYPKHFSEEAWAEQYLLQALLMARPIKVLWPGYYISKSRPELYKTFPFLNAGPAQSFWFET